MDKEIMYEPPQHSSEDIPIDPVDTPFSASPTLGSESLSGLLCVKKIRKIWWIFLIHHLTHWFQQTHWSLQCIALADDPQADQWEHQEVFELFHDALDSEQFMVDTNDETLLMGMSTSTDEAAAAPPVTDCFKIAKTALPFALCER